MLRPSLLANYNKRQKGTSTAEEPSKRDQEYNTDNRARHRLLSHCYHSPLPSPLPSKKSEERRPSRHRRALWESIGSGKSSRISLDQQSGRGVPRGWFRTLGGRHAATTENSRQARSATQTDNLAQKRFKWRKAPARNLEIKKFPRHKPAL